MMHEKKIPELGLKKNKKILEEKIFETKNLANVTISSNANEEA